MTSQVEVELLQLPAASPWREPKHDELLMLTLYACKRATSTDYELRATYIGGGKSTPVVSAISMLFLSEAEAAGWMDTIYPTMNFMGRSTDDDPAVLGVWL